MSPCGRTEYQAPELTGDMHFVVVEEWEIAGFEGLQKSSETPAVGLDEAIRLAEAKIEVAKALWDAQDSLQEGPARVEITQDNYGNRPLAGTRHFEKTLTLPEVDMPIPTMPQAYVVSVEVRRGKFQHPALAGVRAEQTLQDLLNYLGA